MKELRDTPKYENIFDQSLIDADLDLCCRNEAVRSEEITSKLRCRYEGNGKPYAKLAPFKLEELSLNPIVYQFHGVLSSVECQHLLEYARTREVR